MLNKHFDMKDMVVANIILGIKITKKPDGFAISQSHYIEKILEKIDKDSTNVARSHVDMILHLSKNLGNSISQLEYAHILGSLMYIMKCSRLDVVHSVSKLSSYTSNPGVHHLKVIVRVFRYLRYIQLS